MASAGKTNIKNVLDSLCKILEFAGCGQLVPEQFRLAKLDKPDVVSSRVDSSTRFQQVPHLGPLSFSKEDKMWRLLCDLVAYLSRHNNQEVGIEADRGSDSLEFVRKELVKYGYSNKQFYLGSAVPSSRLLLVTIGWLLSSQDMLELFILDMQTYDQILEVSRADR